MMHAQIAVPPKPYLNTTSAAMVEEIVKTHGGLVRRIAWRVHSGMSSAIAVDDLIQIGLMALVEAAQCFEERGAPFAPYAATRVRGAMIDHLRREAHIARQGIANRKRLAETRRRLENSLCREASDAEMAEALALAPEDYWSLVSSSQSLRFDAIDDVYSDSSSWFIDVASTPEQELLGREIEDRLAGAITSLDERSAMVLQLYFKEGLNLSEIAATLGVSAPRICQIKKDALDQVRDLVQDLIDD
jgi:RNA polymerase sigma factor FliA